MIEYLKYIAVGVCFVPFNWRLHAENISICLRMIQGPQTTKLGS